MSIRLKQVGVLTGGQLGRMLGLAGVPLGLQFRFFDPASDACAREVGELHVGSFDDEEALRKFASGLDVITCEFENVPVQTLRFLSQFCPVRPRPEAIEAAQDRVIEKNFFRSCEIPTPRFSAIDLVAALHEFTATAQSGVVLKTRRFGYDGKGQTVVRGPEDVERAWKAIGERAAIAEEFVQFEREVSIVVVRALSGDVRFYPLTENVHKDGILRRSIAPAPDSEALQAAAEKYARKVVEALDYVGVLTIEFFVANGSLIANEIAPRVHNSGHWTIEGAETSQFENHLRAVAGLPLGSTQARGFSVMWNLLADISDPALLLEYPGVHLHDYGKLPRERRKVGHLTLRCDTQSRFDVEMKRLGRALKKMGVEVDLQSDE